VRQIPAVEDASAALPATSSNPTSEHEPDGTQPAGVEMATGAQSGEDPPPKKDLRISSQETLRQSVLSPAAAQEEPQRRAAVPAAPGQDCLSTSDPSRPPIAATEETLSREPVRAAVEVQPQEATRRNQAGQRLTRRKFGGRLIIMASAIVLALVVAVSTRTMQSTTGGATR